ncbi:MAG: hypothetical protein ABW187_08615 [Dokdonella sp.]
MPRDSQTPPPRPFGIAIALMCALAGGAVWCLLSLYSRGDLAAFAFIVALCIVWQLRANGYAGRWSGALIAALCVALAAVYSFYLQAVAQVASLLGLPMRSALLQIDPAMAVDIARANLRGGSGVLVLTAVVAAAVAMLATRTGRIANRS